MKTFPKPPQRCFWPIGTIKGWVGPTGFSSKSTPEDVLKNIDLSNKLVLVTGANSGIGKETACAAFKHNAHVIFACRNVEEASKITRELNAMLPKGSSEPRAYAYALDLSSLESVYKFCLKVKSNFNALHVLVNNAGIMGGDKFERTVDGHEKMFQVNYLAHAMIVRELFPLMRKAVGGARVVSVSSHVHFFTYSQGIDFSKVTGANAMENSDTARSYGQSKLAQIIFTRDMQALSAASRRAFESEILFFSVHPGAIETKGSKKHENGWKGRLLRKLSKPFIKTVEQGASTTCFACFHKDAPYFAGYYLADCNFFQSSKHSRKNRALREELREVTGKLIADFKENIM